MTTPQHLSDRYELGEILGFGGMSEVHRAHDNRLHRDVAVKVLRADLARDPSFYLRFRREAQNAAALNHPAIVAVYDTGEAETDAGPLPYIVMEYVDGVTLRDIVHNDGPMPPERAIEVIADACQALNFSHQHGIVHRDVKPANIMISKTNAVKVMDFGIARAIADAGNSVTQTAAVIGTAQYLSPEQARGEAVDARSDVYSLGCVLYEILTGEPPFVGDSPVAVAYQHVREDPIPPSHRLEGISADLDAVVLKALAKNPDNRYQTAAEMRTDLVRVHNGEPPEAPKVLTDAERTSLLAHGRGPHTDPLPRQDLDFGSDDRTTRGSVGRWLAVVAVLAILTVVASVVINKVNSPTHQVQVPLVVGHLEKDAVATLQNQGFKVNETHEQSIEVKSGYVISTDPAPDATVNAGSEITVTVSLGPPQVAVPDIAGKSYHDAEAALRNKGFTAQFTREGKESTPEQKGKVLGTNPAAGTPTAVNFPITIYVGTGPKMVAVPDVAGQTPEEAQNALKLAGFANVNPVQVDSTLPAGRVVGTKPAAGETIAVDTVVELQVSKGNQFTMPDLSGMFWVDAEPKLRQLGWTGKLESLEVDAGGDKRAKVVAQSPAAGQGVNYDAAITLTFGR